MVLNKFMHPKNPYKKKQPCFKDLAVKYETFRKHSTQDAAGKVHIDFKDSGALKALSWALLKDDFNLEVDMPLDRLIPTIPLRLNYILWLTDIVGKEKIRGLDIGCGASCVYPLLGAQLNGWKFLATECDDKNYEFAKKNVETNSLSDLITIIKVDSDEQVLLKSIEADDRFDFTMCNPPFFGSNLEAYALTTSRNEDRAEPHSINTASESESITPGGEVEFVSRMIDESLQLKDRVRVYTTMLGKKSSVGLLKEKLRQKGIKNMGSYEFCQGRTMRWGLGWTFDPDVKFPKSPFQASKTTEKGKGPLIHTIPKEVTCCKYDIQPLGGWLVELLKELRLKFLVIMDCEVMWSVSVTARENTWSHQRRKRRAEKRMQEVLPKKMSPSSSNGNGELDMNRNRTQVSVHVDSNGPSLSDQPTVSDNAVVSDYRTVSDNAVVSGSRTVSDNAVVSDSQIVSDTAVVSHGRTVSDNDVRSDGRTVSELSGLDKVTGSDPETSHNVNTETQTANQSESSVNKPVESSTECSEKLTAHSSVSETKTDVEFDVIDPSSSKTSENRGKSDIPVLFDAWFTFKYNDNDEIILEMKWLKGTSKESMHQVMQLIINRLKV